MLNNSFTYNKATITVHPPTVEDELDIDYFMFIFGGEGQRSRYKWREFGRCLILSEVDGDLGFPWTDPDGTETEIQAAFDGWRKAGNALLTDWRNALSKAETGPNNPALQPSGDTPKNAETRASSNN